MKISIFESAKNTKPQDSIVFEQYLEQIKSGFWEEAVIKVRAVKQTGTKEQYQAEKLKVPAVTASGVFAYRNMKGLETHSGIIAIDIDMQDNEIGIPKDQLAADPYTYALHHSVGGDGVVVYVKIDPEKHSQAFLGLENYYLNKFEIVIDQSCKDVSRLRYVSLDADLVINEKAKVFKQYIAAKRIEPQGRVYTQTNNDIEHIINQLSTRGLNITGNYADFLAVGMGIAKEYGEGGRAYIHQINSICPKYNYNKVDRQYTAFVKSCHRYKYTLGSFIWLASQAGVETKTQLTTFVESVAKSRKAMVGQNGGVKNNEQAFDSTMAYLAEMEDIKGDDVAHVVKKVMEMSKDQTKSSLTGDILTDCENYIKQLPLDFNEITRGVELNKVPIKDYDVNGLYFDAMKMLSGSKGKLAFSDFNRMIKSKSVSTFHPFKQFFQKYAAMQPTGLIDELIECLELNGYTNEDAEIMQTLVGKWLLSIISSMHGVYSINCLVLCGGMGKGKTNFFRDLLPKELQRYYAESKLDRDKDDEILMTQKLIILDDEFSGKSKKDSSKFKDLLSKQWFNVRTPYAERSEDLLRIAVLCGTTNNQDVLNDLEGNRRIIPINIKQINWEKYKLINKTMLFMELYYLYIDNVDDFKLTEVDVKNLNRITVGNEETCAELEAFNLYFGQPEDYPNFMPEKLTPTEIRIHIEACTNLRLNPTKLGSAIKKAGFEKMAWYVFRQKVYGYSVARIKS